MTVEVRKKILEVAKYIIENKATIEDVSNHFNLSKSTIKKYINDKDKLISINEDIYNMVKEIQKDIIHEGVRLGGKLSSRKGTFKNSDYEILEIIEDIISNSITLEEASIKYDIPTSTLYERIINYDDKQLVSDIQIIFDNHKKGK